MNGRGMSSLPCSVACNGSEWPKATLALWTREEALAVPHRGSQKQGLREAHTSFYGGEGSCRIQDLGHVSGYVQSFYVAKKGLCSEQVKKLGIVWKDQSYCVSVMQRGVKGGDREQAEPQPPELRAEPVWKSAQQLLGFPLCPRVLFMRCGILDDSVPGRHPAEEAAGLRLGDICVRSTARRRWHRLTMLWGPHGLPLRNASAHNAAVRP